MIDLSKNIGAYLESDLAEFIAFDATIYEEFLTWFKTLLVDASADVTDNVFIDRQVKLTEEANKVHKESVD